MAARALGPAGPWAAPARRQLAKTRKSWRWGTCTADERAANVMEHIHRVKIGRVRRRAALPANAEGAGVGSNRNSNRCLTAHNAKRASGAPRISQISRISGDRRGDQSQERSAFVAVDHWISGFDRAWYAPQTRASYSYHAFWHQTRGRGGRMGLFEPPLGLCHLPSSYTACGKVS